MNLQWSFLLFLPLSLFAAEAPKVLTLEQYLSQVRTGGPEARTLVENVNALKFRLNEATSPTALELYGEAGVSDDESEKLVPFMGTRTEGRGWKLGLKKAFTTGTAANLYYDSRFANLTNAFGIQTPNYWENRATFELSQSLWRNGFGAQTSAEIESGLAMARSAYLNAAYELKNLLLSAENTYWSLVTYNQIIKLQEENVDRSRKLRDVMRRKAGLRLSDDVEAIQAQASLETRELELQTSLDERADLIRKFNTLRGSTTDAVEALAEFPEKELSSSLPEKPRMAREDFLALKAQAESIRNKARASRSKLRPQLDLVGQVSANGMDGRNSVAYDEVAAHDHPSWSVGLKFSAALDFGLIGEMASAYRAEQNSANEKARQAEFVMNRTYAGLKRQHEEARRRFEKAVSLENVLANLVRKERSRLANGRTTTFQLITFEQNLAAGQVQRVRAQLSLMQIFNVLKTFNAAEVSP